MGLPTYKNVLKELRETFGLKENIARDLLEKNKSRLIDTEELNNQSLADFVLADKIVQETYQDNKILKEHLEL